MERRNLNAAKLAQAAGLGQSAVYDILNGRSMNPRLDTLERLAEALRMPPSALLAEPSDDALDQELVELLDLLPEVERRRFLMMARAYVHSDPDPTAASS